MPANIHRAWVCVLFFALSPVLSAQLPPSPLLNWQLTQPTCYPQLAGAFTVVADIDGDGDDDALYPRSGSFIGTLVNNFPTSFFEGPFIPVAQNPNSIDAGDVDADGDVDFLSVGSNVVSVTFNYGTSVARIDFPHTAGNAPGRLVDFDGDGDKDVLLGVNQVWLNNGSGSFSGPTMIPLINDVGAWADLDADGDLDRVRAFSIADPYVYRYWTTVEIWRQDGLANFTLIQTHESTTVPLDEPVSQVGTADVNGDGSLDVMLAGIWDGADLAVLLGAGAGFVYPAQGFVFISLGIGGLGPIRAADLDDDGFDDIYISGLAGFSSPAIYLFKGSQAGLNLGFPGIAPLTAIGGAFLNVDNSGGLDLGYTTAPTVSGLNICIRTSNIFQIGSPPLTLSITSGAAQDTVLGQTYLQPVVARLRDADGVPVAGQNITFAPTSGSANPTVAVTDAGGFAQTTITAGTQGGIQGITATAINANATSTAIFEIGLFATSTSLPGGSTAVSSTFRYPYSGVPLLGAVDLPLPPPGFIVTPYGNLATSILNPSSSFAALDGLGVFGPPNPAFVTSPNWTFTSSVNSAALAGLTIVLQVYAIDAAKPFPQSIVISNPVSVTF